MNVFVGVFALAIGIGSVWFSLKFLKLYFKVKAWEKVEAKVLSKEITMHTKYSTARTPYKLNANYTYKYKNEEYKGRFIYLAELMGGQANHMRSDAENRLEKINENMTIYVNPKDPKESVMYCEGVGLYYFTLFMGLFAFVFAFVKFI